LGKNIDFCLSHSKKRFELLLKEILDYLKKQFLNYTYYDMICNDSEFASNGGCVRRLRKQKVDFNTISKIIRLLHNYFEKLQKTNLEEITNTDFILEKNLKLRSVVTSFGAFMLAQISDNALSKDNLIKQAKEFNDVKIVFPSPYDVKNQLTLFQTLTRINLLKDEINKSVNLSTTIIEFIACLPKLLNSLTSSDVNELKQRVKIASWFVANSTPVDEMESKNFVETIYESIEFVKHRFD
jgi:hypothetical protein